MSEGHYWAEPLQAQRFHIFESGRSLCGGWMMTKKTEPVEDDDSYREGKDCKACCRKAGLLNE